MFYFDYIAKDDIKEHHANWPELLTIHMKY